MTRCAGFSKGFTAPERRRELPSRHISLMISFRDPLMVVGDRGARPVGSFVAGLQSRAAITERFGHQHGMHVQLAPLRAYALFGVPMAELTDSLVDLPAVLGNGAAELVERLAAAPTWSDRFAILQAALAWRIAGGPRPHRAVAEAWRQLRETNGSVRIEDVVKRSGHSHRHLVARFTEQVGMSPKAAARVLRFEHSVRLLERADTSLADVAAATGHYDQSHLTREVRALAGCSPTELLGKKSTM
jgi:AraC-like DNA-binding protein